MNYLNYLGISLSLDLSLFPNIEITGHFIRTAREILKESNGSDLQLSTNKQNIDSLDQDNTDKTDNFKEVASDKEEESNKNDNYSNKDCNTLEAISEPNKF